MEIIKSQNATSKKDIYNLTRSPEIRKMSDNVGTQIAVDKYVIYSDVNSTGSETEILSIQDKDGTVYATNSKTARGEFEYITDLMEEEPFTVKVVKGTSKNGREYVTLVLV